jgi:hypothetical protein
MPFLGKSPSDGNHNVLLDAITTSATATYNLTKDSVAYTPVSAQSLMVSLNGVTQAPIAAYTVSGSTIVFASALTSNDVIDYIIAFEGPRQAINASDIDDGTITTAMIADNAITSAKIGVDVIVAEDLAANSITVSEITDDAVTQAKIADDAVDEARLQISNSGTNGHALTYQSGNTGKLTWAAVAASVAGITTSADGTAMTIDSSERIVTPNQPMFYATTINAVSGGSLHTEGSYEYSTGNTAGTIQGVGFAKIWINIGSHFSNTTGVFTCPIAGRYLAWFNLNYHINTNWTSAYMMWNAKVVGQAWVSHLENPSQYANLVCFALVEAAANDKIWPGYNSGYGAPHIATSWGYDQCGIMLIG